MLVSAPTAIALPSRFAVNRVAASAAALFALTWAASCAPLPPRGESWPSVSTAADEAADIASQQRESAEQHPNGCPFDLRRADGHETRVTYDTPEDTAAQLRVFTEGIYDDGGVLARHEQRDLRGLEIGHTRYRCDARGLHLEALVAGSTSLTFSPPLLVYPAASTSLAVAGVATVGDVTLPYTHTLVARDAEPLLALDADAGPWMQTAYVLALGPTDDVPASRWEGATTWSVLYGVPVPALRQLEITDAGAVVRVTEAASTILP